MRTLGTAPPPSPVSSPSNHVLDLGRLFDRYGHAAYSLAFAITGDHEDAEQAVHAAFLDTGRVTAAGDPGGRLMRAVQQQSRRIAGQRSAAAEPHAAIRAGGSDTSPEPALLEPLPPLEREIVALACYRGLTYTEVATRLALPPSEVISRMTDALKLAYASFKAVGHTPAPPSAPESGHARPVTAPTHPNVRLAAD